MVVSELLDGLGLSTLPALPEALCRGRQDWDPKREREVSHSLRFRHQDAARARRRCPEFEACAAWLASLTGAERPLGAIVAGRLVEPGRNTVVGIF